MYPESFRMHNDTLNMRLCFKKDALRFLCVLLGDKREVYTVLSFGEGGFKYFLFSTLPGEVIQF